MNWLCLVCVLTQTDADSTRPLRSEGALVRLIEQVDVPARDAGVLAEFAVKEGQSVKRGDVLGRLDDAEQVLAVAKAELELETARRKAESDVPVRAARKGAEVAKADLDRALLARQNFKEAISDSEVDSLRLKSEKAVLEIEQALLEGQLAEAARGIRANELDVAKMRLSQRRVAAPLDGIVVQLYRQPGEWVQPGEKAVRVLRLDRLRVEAFLPESAARPGLVGAKAMLRTGTEPGSEFSGEVVFVSPEVDPVNGQVRVWAEVANREMQLRPGHRGILEIGLQLKTAARKDAAK
jgi:macrolide-specific efflux system membrane fusion protein